jgi:BASS family bile acid:Na+ symporter
MNLADLIRYTLMVSILVTVAALGIRYSSAEAGYLVSRPGLLARSILAMNVILPLIVVWLALRLDLKRPVEIALVALSLSPLPPLLPGKRLGLTSFGYVYGLVATAAVLSVVLVPVSIAVLTAHTDAPHVGAGRVVIIVLLSVLLPLGVGMLIRRFWPERAPRIATVASRLGGVLLPLALIAMFWIGWSTIRSLLGDGTLLAIVAFTCIGLAIGHLSGGPIPQNRSVLAIATASRHPGVALAIAGATLSDERLAAAAILLALLVGAIVTAPYAAWRRRVHSGSGPHELPDTRTHPTYP